MVGNFKKNWLVVLCLFLVACGDSHKVTDPTDPRFDPKKFSFEDYDDATKIGEVLRAIFPVGTPLNKIEALLLNINGVEKSPEVLKEKMYDPKMAQKYSHTIVYIYTPPDFIKTIPFIINGIERGFDNIKVYKVIIGLDKNEARLYLRVTY